MKSYEHNQNEYVEIQFSFDEAPYPVSMYHKAYGLHYGHIAYRSIFACESASPLEECVHILVYLNQSPHTMLEIDPTNDER
jgi:hypothetical protein